MPARSLACVVVFAAALTLPACKEEVVEVVEPPPRPIKIYRLQGGPGDARPDYPGRIKSSKVVELAFEVAGRITDWNVEEGQQVKKGQILSRLDPRDYQAEVEAARARLRLAEAEYRRESKLFASGSGTQRDLDVATRSRDVSRAELRIKQKALEETRLRAIFDGVIARKLVTDYRNVAAREPVLLLQDESVMEVVVDVPESDLATARRGDIDFKRWNAKAKPVVELSSLPGKQFPVTLTELATAADPSTRTFRATFVMEKPETVGVLAGMTAKLVLTGLATTAPEDYLVPAQAVIGDSEENPFVWIVDDSMTVSKRPIDVGKVTGDRVVVTEGLEGGEAIAMTGVHLLTEGLEVTEMEQSDETRQ